MGDNSYNNMLRRHANNAIERAIKWENLAKDNKARGYIDLAIIAARQARRCRQDARRNIK